MTRFRTIIAMSILCASAAQAEGIPVEPGLWEMTSTMTMPMLPQPRVTTVTECMQKSEISMDEFNTSEMDPACSFSTAEVDGNTLKWSFDCPVEGGTSHGEWEAVSEGDSVSGSGLITMSFQGQTMEMKMSWEGKRIGACP
ncbi:MAG: DUF3617 family protein [Xanthomonadales bacterium]|nr:DUF3617 domain-containing protein [Gammaproteobacteria bacterium]MBT8053532.1 DUF3617 domain-containing protein [Gammaproteobacteria bacterium]NND57987.1 DUF3617 family protein [Xanthomonadales bacterium]NNK50847.1 DUF3617 family protein [Xanthomonadales bacterium]